MIEATVSLSEALLWGTAMGGQNLMNKPRSAAPAGAARAPSGQAERVSNTLQRTNHTVSPLTIVQTARASGVGVLRNWPKIIWDLRICVRGMS